MPSVLLAFALALSACAGAREQPGSPPGAGPTAHEAPAGATAGAAATAEAAPAKEPAPRAPRPWDGATEWTSSAGAYLVRFRPDPAPIPDNETFALDVWVFDPQAPDAPLRDVELSVDAGMPQHGHGMNVVPEVERREDGGFRVRGLLFHMTGEWQLYLDVTRGAITERAQYPVLLE